MLTLMTLVFLAVLSSVLLLGGASYVSRGAVKRGTAIILLALGLIGTSVFTIYPALNVASDADRNYLMAEIAALRAERDQIAADLVTRARDAEALAKTSAFFSKLHKERLTRISDELQTITSQVLGPDSGMVLASADANASVTSFLDGPNGFDSILAELKRLKTIRLRAPGDVVAPTLALLQTGKTADAGTTGAIVDAPRGLAATAGVTGAAEGANEPDTLSQLHRALDSKMSTNSYRIEPLSETELVAGRKGRYYLVELKNGKTGDRFTFDSGKYTFQTSRNAYKAAFNSFAADVLKQLDPHAQFDLYVRGSADAQAYSGTFEPGFDYRKITYLPSTRGSYLAKAATIVVSQAIKNTDLPNLRGEYLRLYLAELYPSKPATLLEGIVTKKDNPAARNTELILFVGWDSALASR